VRGDSTELGRLPRVSTCANLMRKICYNNKDQLMAGLICGGWDPYEGGQVYEIPLGGTIMKQNFAIGGSGSTYIYGLVDSLYREGMTKAECKDFVKKGMVSCSFCSTSSSFLTVRTSGLTRNGERRVVGRSYSSGRNRPDGRREGSGLGRPAAVLAMIPLVRTSLISMCTLKTEQCSEN
jgi:20S proteasome subunit beta 1